MEWEAEDANSQRGLANKDNISCLSSCCVLPYGFFAFKRLFYSTTPISAGDDGSYDEL